MQITKGIIAAAGKGTRFLPATRAIPKGMLPIVDKPIIQYIAEEFVSAGIKEIVIVTSSDSSSFKNHFSPNRDLEQHLLASRKTRLLRDMQRLTKMAKFIFLRQKGPYGNGTPCLTAAKAIGRQPFAYAFGDDLVLSKTAFTKQMVSAYNKRPGLYAGVQNVARHEVHKYGIIDPTPGGKHNEIQGIIEKPTAAAAPSRLAEFGRFILPPEIFPILAKKSLGKGGELWLIDAIAQLIRTGHKAYYKKVEQGRWYTTGDPVSYLTAVRAFALWRSDYRNKVKQIFK